MMPNHLSEIINLEIRTQQHTAITKLLRKEPCYSFTFGNHLWKVHLKKCDIREICSMEDGTHVEPSASQYNLLKVWNLSN